MAPPVPPDATGPGSGGGAASVWTPRRRALTVAAIIVALLMGVGGTAAYAADDEIPRGTSVLGVDIGGRSRADAAEALRAGLAGQADLLNAPVRVRLGDDGEIVEIDPADVGLTVDVDATVTAAEAAGNPFTLLFGARPVDPVMTVDPAKLHETLREELGEQAEAMRMPAVTFDGTTPKPVYPKPGKGLDARRSAEALRADWLRFHPVTVPLVDRHPATTAQEVDRLVAELATPAVSKPVTVTTERGTLTVPPKAIAESLLLTADDTGRITPKVDEKKLRAALTEPLGEIEVAPRNATVSIVKGKPKITEDAEGQRLDIAALSRDLLGVLPRTDDRTVTGTLTTAKPKTTTEAVAKLGITERVSTFTTKFTGGLSDPRSHNIVQIAKEVDGALLKPGQTFSLNGHTGQRSYRQGYKDAPVILDGKLVPGVGGGASQFTTTLFNAAYYAGLEDVEHKPHSYYFSRYPAVIESTIFYPTLDLKFRNNTDHGVLIETSNTNNSVTVSIWSTKIWDKVTTQWSPRRNATKPRTVTLPAGDSCIETSGIDGFTQDAWRIFERDGKEVDREKFTWTYEAEPRYLCRD